MSCMRLSASLLRSLTVLSAALTIAAVCGVSTAQQLAHPGWRGNNIAPEAWWRHTTLVRFPADTTFAQATAALDEVNAVGADSLILPDPAPPAGASHPFADSFGTEDQFDALLRETSARRMHVLLHVPLARLGASAGELRFWMNRGIAGFDLGTLTGNDTTALQNLRAALDHYPGQRILLAKTDGGVATDRNSSRTQPLFFRIVSDATPASASAAPQFVELSAVADAAGEDSQPSLLRSFLPLLLAPGQPVFDSRVIHTAAGRDALQQMLGFRSSHPSLRSGHAIVLQSGDLRAWLVKSTQAGQRSLVLLENAGTARATLHLQQSLHAVNARGTFLRPILRTDGGMGAIDLEGSSLPPGAIAICELQ